MKKLNETQVTIFKEEVKRASFLREAKKTLNLEVYKKIVAGNPLVDVGAVTPNALAP